VPNQVRRRAGIKEGNQVEFEVSGGVINIVPKLPSADDEYTPEQRRIIDARLAEGLADIKAGRTLGPCDSADAMVDYSERAGKTLQGLAPDVRKPVFKQVRFWPASTFWPTSTRIGASIPHPR
jgi:bifunctional DNA-binding transcriptional regulator/antitoxin component of YhaV-PrlF toxin-antitoxin module